MANDRLFIECKKCKETVTLVNYRPGMFSMPFSIDYLDGFLNKHLIKCHEMYEGELESNTLFNLITEGMFTNKNSHYEHGNW